MELQEAALLEAQGQLLGASQSVLEDLMLRGFREERTLRTK